MEVLLTLAETKPDQNMEGVRKKAEMQKKKRCEMTHQTADHEQDVEEQKVGAGESRMRGINNNNNDDNNNNSNNNNSTNVRGSEEQGQSVPLEDNQNRRLDCAKVNVFPDPAWIPWRGVSKPFSVFLLEGKKKKKKVDDGIGTDHKRTRPVQSQGGEEGAVVVVAKEAKAQAKNRTGPGEHGKKDKTRPCWQPLTSEPRSKKCDEDRHMMSWKVAQRGPPCVASECGKKLTCCSEIVEQRGKGNKTREQRQGRSMSKQAGK